MKIINANFAKQINNITPSEQTFSTKNFIYWGEGNCLPNHLIDLSISSPTNAALIKKKTDMVAGLGFIETPENANYIKNEFGEDNLNMIGLKMAFDINLFSISFLCVIRSKENHISCVEHIPAEYCRIEKPDAFGDINNIYVTKDWNSVLRGQNKPSKLPIFKKDSEEKKSVLIIQEYTPGFPYYGLPDYFAGINSIQTEVELCKFFYKNILNNFTPSAIVNFKNGEPPDEQKEEIYRNIKSSLAGVANSNELVVMFQESKEGNSAIEILPFQSNDNDKKYLKLSSLIISNIVIAHRIPSSELVGLAIPGKLGNSDLTMAYAQLKESVIVPKQKLIENSLFKIFDTEIIFKQKDENLNTNNKIDSTIPNLSIDNVDQVQDTALNGAQVTSLVDVVKAVTEGIMPPQTAIGVIKTAFPSITQENIDSIINPLMNLNTNNK